MKRKYSPSTITITLDDIPALISYYYECSPAEWNDGYGDPGTPEHEDIQIVSIVDEQTGEPIKDIDDYTYGIILEEISEQERN